MDSKNRSKVLLEIVRNVYDRFQDPKEFITINSKIIFYVLIVINYLLKLLFVNLMKICLRENVPNDQQFVDCFGFIIEGCLFLLWIMVVCFHF